LSVRHTGTRYTRDHLSGWGVKVLQRHVDAPQATSLQSLQRPAVVCVRDPYMCFLSWWKLNPDVIQVNIALQNFFPQWDTLRSILRTRDNIGAPTVIFHVDREPIDTLAERVGIPYKPVAIKTSASYISDKYVQPRYEALPQELHALAAHWGYSRP